MAENTFSRFEKSQIMNTAKVLKSFITKKMSIQRKINELEQEIAGIDATQKKWEGPIMDLLHGHRIEDVVEYKQELTASGKYSTKVVFRYPDTILPPENTAEPECPNHETAHDEPEPATEEKEPEYDSAGFSSEDGLAEGEPAELAEAVNDEDPFGIG